jgi:tetratricopeptide (TPR) repeat protein
MVLTGCAGQTSAPTDSSGEAGTPAASEREEATYHLMLGEMALQRGQLDEAVREYRLAAEAGSDPSVAERATELALMVGDEDEALLSARRWYELAPGQEAAASQYAVLLINAGKTRPATEVVRDLRAIYEAAGEPHAALLLMSVAAEADDSGMALEVMTKVLGKMPSDAGSLVVLSSLSQAEGEDKQAEKYARAAVMAEPDWGTAIMQLAHVLVSTGRVDEGLALAGKHVAAGAEISARLEFARLLSVSGDYAAAGLILEQILLERPGLPPALSMMGYVEYRAGRPENARRYYSRLAASERHFDEAYYYLGQISLDQGDGEAAAQIFQMVPEGDYFLAAQFGIRDALVLAGKPDAALEYLQQVAETYPQYQAQMLIARAELLGQQDRSAEAIELYRQALEMDPDNVQLRYGMAMALEQSGQVDQAIEMLRWMVERDPEDATALNALGYTLADHQRDIGEAYRYISKAYKKEPLNPAVVDSMGWVEYRRGNLALALDYLRQAYALFPDAEIAAHMGEVLWVLGRQDEARSVWEQALAQDPENRALLSVIEQFGQ